MRKIAGYGWHPSLPDHRDYTLVDPHAPAKLPVKVSLRTNPAMPPIYNQGQLGSCTAQAIAAVYEFELNRQHEGFMPSRLWIYYQERAIEGTVDQDAGAAIRDGLQVVSQGVPPEKDWPYDIATFAGPVPTRAKADASKSRALSYFSLTSGAPGAPLRACLAAGFPFVFGFSVPESFESQALSDGTTTLLKLPRADEQFVGGHAVVAVGYDFTLKHFPVPVFEVRNSWGAQWGDHGHFFMDYRYFQSLASDLWTIRRTT